jgi:hypothetical protein
MARLARRYTPISLACTLSPTTDSVLECSEVADAVRGETNGFAWLATTGLATVGLARHEGTPRGKIHSRRHRLARLAELPSDAAGSHSLMPGVEPRFSVCRAVVRDRAR